jgi:putative MATE family efflux protein
LSEPEFLTSGRALDREILTLALPAAGHSLTTMGYLWIHTYWVGRLADPDAALAALSIAGFTIWIHNSLAALVAVGLTALVARYRGAGRPEAASYVASQGLRSAVALAIVLGILGGAAAPLIFRAAGAPPDVAAQGTLYVRIYWLGGAGMMGIQAATSAARGYGDTLVPFLVSLVCLALNAAIAPFLINGAGPVPALGVSGAALATVISGTAGAVSLTALLRRQGRLSRIRPPDDLLRLDARTAISSRRPFGVDPAILLRLVRIGVPVATSGVFFSAIYLFLSEIVLEAGGKAAQAGLGIGHRGEGPAVVVSVGFAAASAALVGWNLGGGRPELASRAVWRSVLIAGSLAGIWSLSLGLFPGTIAGIFVGPGPALDHAASYFRIVSLCLVSQTVEIVLDGAFGGAGMTLPPLLVSGTLSLARIPLAYGAVRGLGLGVESIWWIISITAFLRGILLALWFARGTWKRRSV